MNLPLGVSRFLAKNVKSFDPKRELEELSTASFSGYLIESSFGGLGVEESALLFRNGQAIGAVYEYYGAHHTLSGDGALPHVMNAFLSAEGVLDGIDLSAQQVDLVVAFNASLKLSTPISKGMFKSLVKDRFDASLGQSIAIARNPAQPASKESLFKKFGLAGIENH
ncbi:MAG: hypothetical protein AABW68_04280 [archaeon]